MNFYTVAAKMIKKAEKAKKDQMQLNDQLEAHGLPTLDPEAVYEREIEHELSRHMKIMDMGMRLFSEYKSMLVNGENFRWYLLTIRPPKGTEFSKFKDDILLYVSKWCHKWTEWAYCFEQVGTTEDELGKGFHVHMRIKTNALNYYPSHVKRDAKKIFTYVHDACIKAEKIVSLARTVEYMDGNKNDPDKESAVRMNGLWRNREGLAALYASPGQENGEAITVQHLQSTNIPNEEPVHQ